ncbi:prolipoprotein diacylglyceryl transferase [Inmirania thermothiophila]|uniref:Phosphatidylglycerol--prolipoprotein diacylglyceryl transferase n=1 Tax=Inmirania thermothiophila TaxID=1750597 RepID=A0A3N1YB86_9GAMM|nr:prolipoprotein diacylglyceryl transferase [Inmirania thermothiophila]ROR34657.1 phosphatidylglycerol:prolipoprotein diacylglycerol transferase [Inmirania thermothiophila]
MLRHPDIDPVAIRLGPLQVHWYGIMYLVGFAAGWWLGRRRAARSGSGWSAREVDDLVFYVALGVILGGRLGYVLFYGLDAFLARPLSILEVWKGGMSFHGGLLGVAVALGLFARRFGKPLLALADFVAPLVPVGLGAGRIGNFINGELWGRPTALPWGMVFEGAGPLPRHPSQLYEAFLEGVVLFALVWWFSARPRPAGAVTGLFLLLYGGFRFLVEFVREPDAHIGFVAFGWMTMGQLLSLPMIAAGAGLLLWALRRREGVA